MTTDSKDITSLMKDIESGETQLPDFQRGWVWDDNRIKALIASILNGYPIGAAMFLEYGGDIRFKYRSVEGAPPAATQPSILILDGQQRLTSIYSALYCNKPAHTRTDKGKEIDRFYYVDIEKILDPDVDTIDAVISVPENKQITSDFGRNIILDLSTPEKEYENRMFPLNIILKPSEYNTWQMNYIQYHKMNMEIFQQYNSFYSTTISPLSSYIFPVITLDKETPKEAVCQVFENVNTGGVALSVFELVTAIFAMDDFELRKDWEERKDKYFSGDILSILEPTDFLMACTLISTYKSGKTVSCKKKDVLSLTLLEYKKYSECLSQGFVEAEKMLQEERIFVSRDLPYSTQLIPLAVLCTLLAETNQLKATTVTDKLKKWYWCGVFGELYGSANETRFVYDVVGVMKWINGSEEFPKTVQDAYFYPLRLLTLQSRQSAAYKGIMALILQNHCNDFISGKQMDFVVYKSDGVDIHHIFPRSYCEGQKYDKKKWNSIVNKTPITYSTNREIGGVAPSKYIKSIEEKNYVESPVLDNYLKSHYIDANLLRTDNFDDFISVRASVILDLIEEATGKPVAGRDSDEVVQTFGKGLI